MFADELWGGGKCFLISNLWLQIIIITLPFVYAVFIFFFYGKSGYLFLIPYYYWQRWLIVHGVHSNGLILWSLKHHWSHKMVSDLLGLYCCLFYKIMSCLAYVRTFYFSICPVSPAGLAKCWKAIKFCLFFQMINCVLLISLNTV